MLRGVACLLALAMTPPSVHASALDVVTELRRAGCGQGTHRTLHAHAQLNKAADQVRKGAHVRDALKRAGYRADQSAVIRLSGNLDDAAIRRMLKSNYCAIIADADLVDIGIARVEREIAFVFAAPFTPPADAMQVSREVLQLVNAARAQPRRCGTKRMPAVAPLSLNTQLHVAARAHAKDMAARGRISHRGADGSEPADRAARAGYAWKTVGENVASGQLTPREVVDGWLSSPPHCENIMDGDFTHMAVAFELAPRDAVGIYWTQVFGRPK